ncbi:methyltransferase domain-containing protein [Salinicola aestuarinus]|uniref:methyltransferase domain-containing protein n=1 Tax=Salinicola aestuarinus TaxID=1949082 RepID=UPI0013003CC2|nr:methyltransferase domain-containing protein [Salinicola aestuarinus]
MSNTPVASHLVNAVQQGRRFWETEPGRSLWSLERACLGPHCEQRRGAVSLQLGMAEWISDMCPVRKALQWAPAESLVRAPQTLVCLPERLPLADDALDLTVIHHLLEAVESPHRLLQEAARVTRADGRLIIFGWHPLGMASFPPNRRPEPWRQTWRTPRRLGDWLAFVDFEIERVDYCGFAWPGRRRGSRRLETLGRRYNLPVAQAYLLVAKQRSIPVQPLRLRQSKLAEVRSGAWSGLAPREATRVASPSSGRIESPGTKRLAPPSIDGNRRDDASLGRLAARSERDSRGVIERDATER